MASAQLDRVLRHLHTLRDVHALDQVSDAQLLQRFADRREEAAFGALLRRHGAMVLSVSQRVLHQVQDAEDVLQATFLVLARKAATIRKRESVASWLHGVARRLALRAKAQGARRHEHEQRAANMRVMQSSQAAWHEVQTALDAALDELPEKYRAVLVLCCLEGKTHEEAAQLLDRRVATVTTHVARGRKLLRDRLAKHGLTLSTAGLAALLLANGAPASAPALTTATMRAALAFAAGKSAWAVASAPVARLVEGGLRTMFLAKLKIATLILAALAAVSAASGLARSSASSDEAKTARASAKPPAEKDTFEASGRVVDPDGKPVAEAKVLYVRALLALHESPLAQQHPQATTDAEGRFALQVATAGYRNEEEKRYWLQGTIIAWADGHAPGWVGVHKAEMMTNMTVKLVKDAPISGRVVDLEGKPIAGATVRVRSLAANDAEDLKTWLEALQTKKEIWGIHYPRTSLDPILPKLTCSATTDGDGKFRLAGFGRERLVGLRFEGTSIETVDVYALTRPAPTIQVLRQKDQPQFGGFTFYGATFDHAAAPTTPIIGVVRDKDTKKPLAGVTIQGQIPSAMGHREEERYVRATTDQDGQYRLVGLAKVEGQAIQALPAAREPYLNSRKQAGGSSGLDPVTLDFDLKRGVRIRGRVSDKATGTPLAGVSVEYFAFTDNPNLRDAPGFRGSGHAGTRSGKDGSFTLVGLPGRGLLAAKATSGQEQRYLMAVGAYAIKGAEPSQRFSFITDPYICDAPLFNTLVEINPTPDAAAMQQDVALDPGKTVTGKIVDAEGNPINVVSIDGVWGLSMHIQDLPTADFRLSAIDPKHPKPYFFRHRDRKLGTALVLRGDEPMPVTVRLQKCGTLTGRLVDEDGQPRADVELTGDIRGGQLNIIGGWYGFINGKTDKDGRFKIESVLPGVKVGLSTQKGASITGRLVQEAILKPGETKELGDLRASPLQ